ncbi:MAG: asparagine synthase (glutamine-hydrolyzing) [Blastocatellia bacterium]
MCGMCGVVSSDRSFRFDRERLIAMRDAIAHRGPDDAGEFIAPGLALGSRRLAILDLSERGHMPMSTTDGRCQIVYNGEVYNFRELRAGLESRGYAFRSNTDTEVLLNLYVDQGPAMLDRLNGMFGVAIWDERERSLFIARDRLGVKPVFYAEHEGALYFASEAKALFAAGVPRRFDPEVWEELLCFRFVAGERTPFAGVRRLLPGHYLQWKDGEIRIARWWSLAERARAARESAPRDPAGWFRETFDSAVALRRISDVPVGVLLSGGLDSGSVAASLASQFSESTASFTVRFGEKGYDEGPLARQVADRWGLGYHELKVEPENLLPMLRRASGLNDEPLVHGNDLYLLAISEYAKPRVTVLLSGEGGDETLGGYVRYRPLSHPRALGLARPVFPAVASALGLRGRMRKLGRFLKLGGLDRFVLFNACETLPDDLAALGMRPAGRFAYREAVLAEAASLYPGEPMRQTMYSDHHTFLCSILDRNDRMTMGASIECRVPFLDYRLVEGLAGLSTAELLKGSGSKPLLRRAVGDRLPNDVLRARKWGFGVPWTTYLRRPGELREFVGDLPALPFIQDAPFDSRLLKQAVSAFLAGENTHESILRQLVMIAVWQQTNS